MLRDEGEVDSRNLREADIDVTAVYFDGTYHDCTMLNALAGLLPSAVATPLTAQALKTALIG